MKALSAPCTILPRAPFCPMCHFAPCTICPQVPLLNLSNFRGGSRQNSPTEEDHRGNQLGPVEGQKDMLEVQPQVLHQSALHLDAPQFEPMSIEPLQIDYSSQNFGMSSMDSPNFNMDYNQQVPAKLALNTTI